MKFSKSLKTAEGFQIFGFETDGRASSAWRSFLADPSIQGGCVKRPQIHREAKISVPEIATLLNIDVGSPEFQFLREHLRSNNRGRANKAQLSTAVAVLAKRDPALALRTFETLVRQPLKRGQQPRFFCTTALITWLQHKVRTAGASTKALPQISKVAPQPWPANEKLYLSQSNWGSGDFCIHYIDDPNSTHCVIGPTDFGPYNVFQYSYGKESLPLGRTTPSANVPSSVQEIGIRLEYARNRYSLCGFPCPTNIGGGPIDVYLVNYQNAGNGWTDLSIWLNSTMKPRDLDHAIAHEYFHLIQFTYWWDYSSGTPIQRADAATLGEYYLFVEGTAELAPELVNASNDAWRTYRYLDFFLTPPEEFSLMDNTIDAGYASCIFWRYFSEQFTAFPQGTEGADVLRRLWEFVQQEISSNGSYIWSVENTLVGFTRTLERVELLRPVYTTSLRPVYTTPLLVTNELVYANWALTNVCSYENVIQADRRFVYQSAARKLVSLCRVQTSPLTIGIAVNKQIVGWTTGYFELDPQGGTVKIIVEGWGGGRASSEAIVQVVWIGDAGQIRNVVRSNVLFQSNGTVYETYVPARPVIGGVAEDITKVYVAVSTFATGVRVNVTAQSAQPAPQPMLTRWNCVTGCDYEIDPRGGTHKYQSPDIVVSQTLHGKWLSNTHVEVTVSVRNRTSSPATGIKVVLTGLITALGPGLWDTTHWQPLGTMPISGTAGIAGGGTLQLKHVVDVTTLQRQSTRPEWLFLEATLNVDPGALPANRLAMSRVALPLS